MLNIRLFSLLFLLFYAVNFSAQNFPQEREKFLKYMDKVMSDYFEKEQKRFFKDELTPIILETKDISDNNFKRLVETCNKMETKRVKYFPEIYEYIFSVYSFYKNKQPESSFQAWHATIDKLIDGRNINKFKDFIELSANFFSKNIIFDNNNAKWIYRGGSYVFEYENNPLILFEDGSLVCAVENINSKTKEKNPYVDSIRINDCDGTYDVFSKKWIGKGGEVTWEKVGLPAGETKATLYSYEISLRTSNLGCDTVALTSPFFSSPILGKFSDRAFRITREEDKTYPQFYSFNKSLEIKELYPNIDYQGAFSLEGKDFIGLGVSGLPSRLKVKRNGKLFMDLSAQLLIINNDKIYSPLCKSTIFIGLQDSVFHPGLDFTYFVNDNTFEFVRSNKGITQAPFINSYHQVDMYVPKIIWKYDDADLQLTYNFGAAQDQRVARLESKKYFDAQLFESLQGLDRVNPLQAIYEYSYKYDEYVVPEGKIASALGKTLEQCRPMILDLSAQGFLNYDFENKIVTVNEKLITFVKSRASKMDYDNLVFQSDFRPKKLQGYTDEQIEKTPYLKVINEQYQKSNTERKGLKNFGLLNLGTLEISLDGVDRISLSDAQQTNVFPTNGKVVIKENRNFIFNGWISSGKLEINTLEADFVYNKNKVNLYKTDKTVLRVNPLKVEDGKEKITVFNQISNLKGELLVDDPENRSGNNKKITDYPKLIASNPTFIYYNQKSLFKGAYDSTRFYFTADPFELDSLDNFKESHLRFEGELTSAGIFPKMREPLKIMPDYSLGFSTKAKEGGVDFYSKEAKYDNKIILSANGLQGAGTINFIHSTSISKGYTFLPDSTVGMAEFSNKKIETGIEYPQIYSPEAYITYVPKSQYLNARSTPAKELSMFDKECRLKGGVTISKTGCTGFGVTTFADANMGARLFKFKAWDIDSDTANFNLKNNFKVDDEDPLALKTENLNAHVSFKDRKGQFKSNSGTSRVEFPVNQYLCKMDFFTWFMDKEEIELSTKSDQADLNLKTDLDLVGANFFSLHPEQDSLRFRSREAKYSLREKTIYCKKVDYLEIADARIFPDSGRVTVRKKARMDPLENSEILANSVTKYHRFINANTEVSARRKYEAVGDYPYYDKDSTMTIIKMDKINVDSTYQTVGVGKIKDKSGFKLSPQFEYYGDVRISANNQFIKFTGATRIIHACTKFKRSWMAFDSDIDPKNIQIPVAQNMKSLDSVTLNAGIVWRESKKVEEVKLYPTFLSQLEDKDDKIAFASAGYLQFNAFTSEFQIASKEKLINRSEPGNFLALQTGSCSLNGEGVIQLGMDYEPVKVEAVGSVNYFAETGKTSMRMTTKFIMPVDEKSFERIANKVLETENLKPMQFNMTSYENALVQWTDRKTADKIKSDYTINNVYLKIPENAKGSIVLSGVALSSYDNKDAEERGLKTDLDEAVLISIFDKPVMKYVPCKLFLNKMYAVKEGDGFGLQISNPSGGSYYFNYAKNKKGGELLILSDDADFESSISGIKADKRKSKDFNYEMTSNRIYLSKFLKIFAVE